jgi:2-dehydropantoate 2-reductase
LAVGLTSEANVPGTRRFVVYGAGAIGAAIGARLFESGHEVLLIARGAHFAALKERGLCYSDPERTRVLPIPVAGHPAEIGWRSADVVLLAVKGQDTQAALTSLAAVAPPTIPIICAQNGVDNERAALRRFARVYGMCVMMPATHVEPGVVDAESLPTVGVLDTGRYPTGVDELVEQVAADLSASGFSSLPDPDIMRWKYEKLLLNLSTGLRAACGLPGGDDEQQRVLRRELESRLRAEALACYAAEGVVLPSAAERSARFDGQLTRRPIPGRSVGGGSGWQSLARRTGHVEVDYVNGEIVLLGRVHGIATPVNETIQRVASDLARRGLPPGSSDLTTVAAAAGLPLAGRQTSSLSGNVE